MLTLSNQRPAVLDPEHAMPVAGAYDPVAALKSAVIEPLLQPLNGSTPTSLVDSKGQTWDEDDLLSLVTRTLVDTVDTDAEDQVKHVLQQGLVHYDKTTPLLVTATYAVQAAQSSRTPLPHPSPSVIYTAATDVVPTAKALLSGGSADEFFASLAYTYSPETLGFWFQTQAAFEEFTLWADQQFTALAAVAPIPPSTTTLMNKFLALRLTGLTEGLVLRKDETDGLGEYSFPRVAVHLLTSYQAVAGATSGLGQTGMLPFHMGELFIPKTLVLANVEVHARSSAKRVDNEWRLINATLSTRVRVISNSALSKLTALPRAMAKASAAAANAQSNKLAPKGRSASVRFRKQPPSKIDLTKGIIRALKRMKEVNRSRNAVKRVKTTFLKASRRDPDDFNRPGRITSTKYLPDLHVYVDTSGSISESNYQDAIIMLIQMAKRMNVDLYFNSFSHVLSQEMLLKTANKSVSRIWQEFRRIPKVSGGTDYRQIWEYINMSAKRRERLSLILTDFEWAPSTNRVPHPPNLYYAPCSGLNWDQVSAHARRFTRSMNHIDPAVPQKLIGITL